MIKWQSLRERLNHDILCNQLRNELEVLRRHPGGSSLHRLEMWSKRAGEYRLLFSLSTEELSPLKLLDIDAFKCWSEEQQAIYGPVLHRMFLVNSGLEKKLETLNSLLDESLRSVRRFLDTPREKRTEEMVIQIQEKVEQLSAKISELPAPYVS